MSTANTESTREPSQDSPEASGRVETPETTPKPGDGHTAPPEPVEPEDVAKLRKEAAGHRVTAREAREELEATQGRLSAVQDALLAGEIRERKTQIKADALQRLGLRDEVFNEDGTVDGNALDAALEKAADMLGIPLLKRPAPDLTTGREVPPGGPEGGVTASSWSQVIGKK